MTFFERTILPLSASETRFFRNSAASDRLVKSVASRIVRLPETNSMYQFLVSRRFSADREGISKYAI